MHVHSQYQAPLVRSAAWVGGALLSVAAFVLLPVLHFGVPVPINTAVHTFLETVSIVVSALVFACGSLRLTRRSAGSVTLVSSLFLGVALLDFLHVLSFEGMPAFITPSGGGKAISFFLAARVLAALAMLVIALRPWRRASRPAHWRVTAAAMLFVAAVSVAGFLPAVKALFFVPGQGLTALKIAAEFLLVGLYALAALAFLRRVREPQPFPVMELFTAAALMGVSELCFTLYSTPMDQYSNLGHLWKVAAYLFVFRAVLRYVVQGPYLLLRQARRDLVVLNATLERRVRERTAQLEAANRNLESFAYSVAHDLRAPLSAINGFSGALARSGGGGLGGQEQHYLDRIRVNSRRMSDMIDAILALARLSRSTVKPAPLDLSALAAEVLDDLRRAEPGRRVEAQIQSPLPVVGDRTLLRAALQNLIGNAWKFSAERELARIEVGSCVLPDGRLAYYVRDNGAGFDMAQAPDLFALFQRLHPDDRYPGHGIGLVNVQRIVALHGGQVWAEAAPGEGATFYFTLAAEPQFQAASL